MAITHLFFADDSLIFGKASREEILTIKDIIKMYTGASGQRVNFEKSEIAFSKVIAEEKKNELGQCSGFPRVEQHGHYLGLPASMGRSKKDIFQTIEERVKKKLKNWKVRNLSQAGKLTLIKSVAQSIPSYSMNCFMLPVAITQRIDSLISNFWWGQRNSEKRIHWCSWEIACDSKDVGGLGFRDFESFNRAFLAKQGWRLLTNHDSLLARCWKARYFPHKNLLDATPGHYPSFTWRSVLRGCEILKNGLRWTVRNGQSVRIWKDQWVPDTIFLTPPPQFAFVLQDDVVVRNLFNEAGTGWNNNLIFSNFPIDVARKITSIPIGQAHQEDCLRWKFTKDGNYSVKSGYWVAKKLKDAASSRSSSSSNNIDHWRWFRHLQLPPKIRLFAWKCMRKILPTRVKLYSRGVDIVTICPNCGLAEETLEHVLRDCDWAKFFWNACPLRLVIQVQSPPISIPEWIMITISDKPSEFVDLFLCLLWMLWRARNLLIFQQRSTSHPECFRIALQTLIDYQNANRPPPPKPPIQPSQPRWKPPPSNRIKFNSDASIGKDGTTGTGGIFRNDEGTIIKLCSNFIPFCSNIDVAEGLGCLHGVRLARDMQIKDMIVELDNQTLVSLLTNAMIPRTGVGTIIEDILHYAKDFDQISFQWIDRKCNTVAHKIANLARNPNFSVSISCPHVISIRRLAILDVISSSS